MKIMASSPFTSWQIDGKTMETVADFIFLGSKSLQVVTAAMKLKDACSLEEELWPPRQHIKIQRHCFINKGPYSQSHGFSSTHVWIWELDHKESWEPKNWCFRTVVLEKTLESPLDCKEIQPVHPKGNQSWMFIGNWNSNTLDTWCEELAHWKRLWCWERLKAKEEGGKGWGG